MFCIHVAIYSCCVANKFLTLLNPAKPTDPSPDTPASH